MRFFKLLLCVMFLAGCGQKNDVFSSDEIYFFYSDGCPHCHHAKAYIDTKYPDLEVNMVDVATPHGYKKLMQAAAKFKITNNLGTPLIVMDDNYIMGWAKTTEKKFDIRLKRFLARQK